MAAHMQKPRKIIPPGYLLIAILATIALHYFLPITRFSASLFSSLGVVLIVAGIGLTACAAGLFARAGTPLKPFEHSTTLVTGGVYRITRNPMYVGLILVLTGVALFCGTAGALLPLPVFVWLLTKQFIEGEEQFLEGIFGEDYLAYKRRVRRWL
jgi:protein-S-isoprenylcysteine O-methyltransferase Ste14